MTKDDEMHILVELPQWTVAWCHSHPHHPGSARLEKTFRIAHWWPDMRKCVETYIQRCHQCQKNKKVRKPCGETPPDEAEPSTPWDQMNINLIGPLTVKAKNDTFTFDALMMIDPATGWFEIKELSECIANVTAKQFNDCWSSKHPRPTHADFDNGGENKGMCDLLLKKCGIERKATTEWTPQSNGVVERVCAVLNNTLRTLELEE